MNEILLNLDNLNICHDTSAKNKVKLFNEILKKCHNKITKYNKTFKKQECMFSPPTFVLGYPPYNFIELINHIVSSLKNNGLKAEWITMPYNSIYISWKPLDINMSLYHSQLKYNTLSDLNNGMHIMTVNPKSKSKNTQPQHVAMVDYGDNKTDLIPINVKAFKK
jgi:hypothetical protein